uniref:Uncharacterized protein n=1 Tax=Aeromonas hydrophila TaxID=644 RepID=Q6TFA6_AERHY|nr:unknown [Aeromonas hydrophila]
MATSAVIGVCALMPSSHRVYICLGLCRTVGVHDGSPGHSVGNGMFIKQLSVFAHK